MKKRLRKGMKLAVVLAAAAAVFWYFQTKSSALYIEAGEGDASYIDEWSRYIAGYYNENGINIIVDGREIRHSSKKVYMDENRVLMISEDEIREMFECAVLVEKDGSIALVKGDTKVVLHINDTEGYKNDSRFVMTSSPVIENGTIYFPLQVMEEGFQYSLIWDASALTAVVNSGDDTSYALPFAYDYRKENRAVGIKDQGLYGTCWAFASLTALETALTPLEDFDFSEDHMSLSKAFDRGGDSGGDYVMATAYLVSWDGPVYEKDDPYGDGVREELSPVKHVQEVQFPEAKDYNSIKKMVFLYGGVQSSIYLSIDPETMDSYYYNKDTNAYCYMGTNKANHDVVIIGWDDSYPADNFAIDVERDGAFICQNSWGDEFGEDGIFYVSYYDTNIGLYNAVYTGVESEDNYDHIYQSDWSGWNGSLGYGKDAAYFANVYTAEEDCTLEAVGFYATGAYTSYTVYTPTMTEEHTFTSKWKSTEGTFTNSGYYTVPLLEPVELKKGESFAVMVYVQTPNSQMPVAVEYKDETDETTIITDGEGYISSDGVHWDNTEKSQNANVCLKAYTRNKEKGAQEDTQE